MAKAATKKKPSKQPDLFDLAPREVETGRPQARRAWRP